MAGGVFHVYARGNGRQLVFFDVADHETYLALLGRVVRRKGWRLLAYCLMDNHVHLLIETPEPNLANGMQRLQSVYAETFNTRHGRSGHLFQGRYGAVRVKSDAQLWSVVRYIARNPVESGVCDVADQFRWSSFGAVLTGAVPAWLDAPRLLDYLGAAGGDPLIRYAEMAA
jgi:putative transposase